MASIEERAAAARRWREEGDALRAAALDEAARLVNDARLVGMPIKRLAELLGYRQTKPLYDAVKRRAGT